MFESEVFPPLNSRQMHSGMHCSSAALLSAANLFRGRMNRAPTFSFVHFVVSSCFWCASAAPLLGRYGDALDARLANRHIQ